MTEKLALAATIALGVLVKIGEQRITAVSAAVPTAKDRAVSGTPGGTGSRLSFHPGNSPCRAESARVSPTANIRTIRLRADDVRDNDVRPPERRSRQPQMAPIQHLAEVFRVNPKLLCDVLSATVQLNEPREKNARHRLKSARLASTPF